MSIITPHKREPPILIISGAGKENKKGEESPYYLKQIHKII
jgi:hypothetical protein